MLGHSHNGDVISTMCSASGWVAHGTCNDSSASPQAGQRLQGHGHSPLGMSMMLKAGWKPGQALGRDPGTLVPLVVRLLSATLCVVVNGARNVADALPSNVWHQHCEGTVWLPMCLSVTFAG